jgi:hypothetical protein
MFKYVHSINELDAGVMAAITKGPAFGDKLRPYSKDCTNGCL